jgi:hypothetical protein
VPVPIETPAEATRNFLDQSRSRKQVAALLLSDPERRDLMRLMHRVLAEIQADKNSWRVLVQGDPQCGRLVKDGRDITDQTYLDEEAANRFLGLLRLK